MRSAIILARKGFGRTSPNPVVGAVIVAKSGKLISNGYHKRAGGDHAEIEAIQKAGRKAKGATLYVTLEPCCTTGRTGPCTKAIISAGIKRVVVGTRDPNPKVAGKGFRALRRAGIEVITGVSSKESTGLNEAYNHYITTGMPFVTLKLAATLDGRIATSAGESKWITGVTAREQVHSLRSRVDAVMVGSGTAVTDDPELTVRGVKGRDPVRVVVDSSLKLTLRARLFRPGSELIIFTTARASESKVKKARALGATVIKVRVTREGLSLKSALKELARRDITSLLIEGGATLAASMIKAGLVQRVALFFSTSILGGDAVPMIGALGVKGIKKALKIKDVSIKKVGEDILIEGYL